MPSSGSRVPAASEYQWQTLDLQTMVRKIVDALQDTIAAKKAERGRGRPAAVAGATRPPWNRSSPT